MCTCSWTVYVVKGGNNSSRSILSRTTTWTVQEQGSSSNLSGFLGFRARSLRSKHPQFAVACDVSEHDLHQRPAPGAGGSSDRRSYYGSWQVGGSSRGLPGTGWWVVGQDGTRVQVPQTHSSLTRRGFRCAGCAFVTRHARVRPRARARLVMLKTSRRRSPERRAREEEELEDLRAMSFEYDEEDSGGRLSALVDRQPPMPKWCAPRTRRRRCMRACSHRPTHCLRYVGREVESRRPVQCMLVTFSLTLLSGVYLYSKYCPCLVRCRNRQLLLQATTTQPF